MGQAQSIQLLILDMDDILTTGTICIGNQEQEYSHFHIHQPAYEALKQTLQLTDKQIAYMSDD